MKAAVIYAAKSTGDPRGSIPTQLADGRSLAEREGDDVAAEFHDEAASAYKQDRGPGLAAALAECERLAPCALIVQHSDRLARGDGKRAAHLVEYALWALKHDVTIRSCQDDQTFGDLLYAVVTGQRNHEDSARKSKAVTAGLKRRAERGQPVGALPIGYRAQDTVVAGQAIRQRVIDPAKAALVERIYALATAGHTPGDISRTLNAEGAVTKRGRPWSTRAVRTVIENRDYLGENGYPQLIDAATWERSQRPERSSGSTSSSPRRAADEFVLSGMVVCLDCGATMRSRRCSTGRRTYRCSNAMEGRNSCTTSRPVPAEDAERELIANAVGYLPTLDDWLLGQVAKHRAEQANAERALTAARKAQQAMERRLERLLDDYERLPEVEARLVLRRATSVETELAEAERRVCDLEAVVSEHELGDPDLEAAHDLYLRLAAFAVGRLQEASSAAEVRAALASLISEVRLGFADSELVVAASLRVVEQEQQTFVYVQPVSWQISR
jgi:site-specific DNA recombinase